MPKIIKAGTKRQIKKCFEHFQSEWPELSQRVLTKRLSDIFGVGKTTIEKILKGGQEKMKTSTSGKRGKTEIFLSHMFRKDLQRLIWQYNSKNENFTLDRLLADARDDLEFTGGRTTLFKILKSMGYQYKLLNGRKLLCEQKHIVAKKIKFLRKFLQFQNSTENVTFVYLDETWIYQNGIRIRRLLHESNESDLKSNSTKTKSEAKRFTVLHAGCNLGFLPGCDMLLDSASNDKDCNKTMNGEIFLNWIVNQLIPALAKVQGKCVVLMDNAPYHLVQLDKPPKFTSTKSEMQEWLVNHNVTVSQDLTKKQVWNLVKPFITSGNKRYIIEDILNENGHEVLRLPPYHCQYNPIELAWAFCKDYYNKHLNSQPSSEHKPIKLWIESLSKCTPDMWQHFCSQCEKLISEDWTKHMGDLSLENLPPFIFSLGESESEDNSDSDSDSSDELMEVE